MFAKATVQSFMGYGRYRKRVYRAITIPFSKKTIMMKRGFIPFAIIPAGTSLTKFVENEEMGELYGTNLWLMETNWRYAF